MKWWVSENLLSNGHRSLSEKHKGLMSVHSSAPCFFRWGCSPGQRLKMPSSTLPSRPPPCCC